MGGLIGGFWAAVVIWVVEDFASAMACRPTAWARCAHHAPQRSGPHAGRVSDGTPCRGTGLLPC